MYAYAKGRPATIITPGGTALYNVYLLPNPVSNKPKCAYKIYPLYGKGREHRETYCDFQMVCPC